MRMEVKLTPQEVENIVMEHLLTKFDKVENVTSVISQEYVGYGMMERQETVYKGIKCEVETK